MDRLDIVEEILKYGKYSIGALDSAVYYAAEKENVEILQLLLKTEKYTEENIYCVFRMSVFSSIEVMKYLLKNHILTTKI